MSYGIGMALEYCAISPQRHWEWGVDDCVAFATHAFYLLTGIDLFDEYRGKYHNEHDASTIIARAGGFEALFDQEVSKHPEIIKSAAITSGEPSLCIVKVGGQYYGAFYTGMSILLYQGERYIFCNERHIVASYSIKGRS